jgi:SPP1 family phage portal protein
MALTAAQIAEIKKQIEANKANAATLSAKFERYKASTAGVPIFNRVMPSYEKVDNRLNNDFVGDVVDTKVGYLVGKPIFVKYTSEKEGEAEKEAENKAAAAVIREFSRRNNLADLDSETVKKASICGFVARLLYVDPDGNTRAMIVNPWNIIAKMNQAGDEVVEAIRYWTVKKTVTDGEGKTKEIIETKAEYYTPDMVYYLVQLEDGAAFTEDKTARTDGATETVNLFAPVVPVIVSRNNDELLGDCDKVFPMIDAYDRAVSDYSSEIETFRLAYLLITGGVIEQAQVDLMRQTGAIALPAEADIKWLTKTFNDSPVGNLLTKLEKNIIRFAKSVDFTDSNFYGNLTRMAIAFKLWNIETKAQTMELKLGTSFRQMWKAVFAAAGKKTGVASLDPLNIEFVFTRNIPVNAMEESQEQRNLVGVISDRTRLSRLSFIKDPDAEVIQMKKERDEKIADGDYSVTATDDEDPNPADDGGGDGSQ